MLNELGEGATRVEGRSERRKTRSRWRDLPLAWYKFGFT